MMPTDRFDRRLPELLEELSQPRTPEWFDDFVGLTARTRQRPAWTLPERWLPMVDVARQPAIAPRLPLRTVGLGLLIIGLILAVIAALVVGSRQNLPAPFGPARNGVVAYAIGGDIYTADPATGAATRVVTGPEIDLRPVFSLDGTRLAFERKASGATGPGSIFVAKADGSGLTSVTEPIPLISHYTFSPDGREILLVHGPREWPLEGAAFASIVKSDGTGGRTLSFGNLVAEDPVYRAPDGREIYFVGHRFSAWKSGAHGLYAIKPNGSGLRTIVAPTNQWILDPRSAPDGKQIAFTAVGIDFNPEGRVFVVDSDGGVPRLLRDVAPGDSETLVDWSNDGERLLISGCYRSEGLVDDCPTTMEVVPVSGRGPVVRIDVAKGFPGADGTSQVWAPDDTSIITTPLSNDESPIPMGDAVSWDALTGRSRPVPWNGAGSTSYQRLAP